ncbi:MAG: anion permease, partial [Hymenobacteraceae bacterium]|nr:anion permease [Hymenobacteraceae bacterium]
YLVLGAVVACSMAFMLPVATPPNAIVYGSRQVPISTMVRTGLVLNVVGTLLITLWVMFYMSL